MRKAAASTDDNSRGRRRHRQPPLSGLAGTDAHRQATLLFRRRKIKHPEQNTRPKEINEHGILHRLDEFEQLRGLPFQAFDRTLCHRRMSGQAERIAVEKICPQVVDIASLKPSATQDAVGIAARTAVVDHHVLNLARDIFEPCAC
jgi:hypothetical protein